MYGRDKPLFHYINNPTEDVNYIENKGGNPYSNTYNLEWRNHPNLRWGRNQRGGNNFNRIKTKPQERANPNDPTVYGQRLDWIEGEMQPMRTKVEQVSSKCTNTTKTLTKLEDQINQLMSMMRDIKMQIGTGIPRNTENNPLGKKKEHVKTIALHSGKVLSSSENPTQDEDKKDTKNLQEEPQQAETKPELEELLEEKQRRDEAKFVSFLNLFKSQNVNLPLINLIEKVPKYAKYLKEIMSRRRKIKTGEQVNVSASCSEIISEQITPKLKDLGSFIIPIEIGNAHFSKALCDLGANFNLMPLTI
ncbi:reverse transcriptase [Gossypium australe]|uniref:Reverse transcriptase n=1 Tax=Gossypium australe TaxID=47621 RepID=A0A5B6UV07_9ROSI|nr:reverse transcriptase [Gossypium australe]